MPKNAHTTIVIHAQHPNDDHDKSETHAAVQDAVTDLKAAGHTKVIAHVNHDDGTTHTING